jgi:sulfur-oxidizing protein SoxY
MGIKVSHPKLINRRNFLKVSGIGTLTFSVMPLNAQATPDSALTAISKLIGSKTAKEGLVKLILTEIAENGGTVPLKVSVESPMSEQDHVKAIHVFTDGNPSPEVASYFMGPQNGKAYLSIRLRLLKTQNVIAVAEISNGEVYLGRKKIKVTIGGCGG